MLIQASMQLYKQRRIDTARCGKALNDSSNPNTKTLLLALLKERR
jgi:hypothetical protein